MRAYRTHVRETERLTDLLALVPPSGMVASGCRQASMRIRLYGRRRVCGTSHSLSSKKRDCNHPQTHPGAQVAGQDSCRRPNSRAPPDSSRILLRGKCLFDDPPLHGTSVPGALPAALPDDAANVTSRSVSRGGKRSTRRTTCTPRGAFPPDPCSWSKARAKPFRTA